MATLEIINGISNSFEIHNFKNAELLKDTISKMKFLKDTNGVSGTE